MKITHPSTGRTAIGLAIIDDHSTITFMDPQALDMMDMPNSQLRESSLATITVQGTSSRAPCHLINGLIVSPLEGDSSITLPPTYIQNTLPNAIDQVPSRKAVASTPGFKHLADRFPAKDVNWPTLLLIGRDCVEAQHQKQIYSKQNKDIIATETPLGMTLIGTPQANRRDKRRSRSTETQFSALVATPSTKLHRQPAAPPNPERRPRNVPQQLNSATASRAQFEQPPRFPQHATTNAQRRTSERQADQPRYQGQQAPSRTTEIFCAWCTESGRNFNHNTPDCYFLEIATPRDRWRVIGKQRTCPLCLMDKHRVANCPQKTRDSRRCEQCRYTHGNLMGCRPQDHTSTKSQKLEFQTSPTTTALSRLVEKLNARERERSGLS